MSDTLDQEGSRADENESKETGSEAGDDEPEWMKCEICSTGIKDLKEHLEERHLDDQEQMREEYPDHYESIVDDPVDSENEPKPKPEPTKSTATTQRSDRTQQDQSAKPVNKQPESESQSRNQSSTQSGSSSMGNKWYIIGVGGAGNKIVDTILIRENSLKNSSKPLADVWEQALTGHGMLNSNLGDMTSTFYYEDHNQEMDENTLLQNSMIGREHPDNDYTGCGRNWIKGRDFIEKDFDVDENEDNPIEDTSGYDIQQPEISRSQAVMIAHSVTGGTGCGAAPIVAREIKKLDNKNKSVFGSIVLPSEEEGEDGPIEMMNGCAGTARMAKYSDAMFIFENDKLAEANPELGDTPELDRHGTYSDKNNAILKYFEIFSMASIDSSNISGYDFDINDALEPIDMRRDRGKDYYEDVDSDDEFDQPGDILAPVISRSLADEMSMTSMEGLAERALKINKLADFDPATAWGGTFVFFGPEEKLDGTLIEREFDDHVQEHYLDKPEDDYSFVTTNTYIISVDKLDSVYLWGFLWNPEVNSLDRMYDVADSKKDGSAIYMERVQENWDTIQGLYELTGRDNMGV